MEFFQFKILTISVTSLVEEKCEVLLKPGDIQFNMRMYDFLKICSVSCLILPTGNDKVLRQCNFHSCSQVNSEIFIIFTS